MYSRISIQCTVKTLQALTYARHTKCARRRHNPAVINTLYCSHRLDQ